MLLLINLYFFKKEKYPIFEVNFYKNSSQKKI